MWRRETEKRELEFLSILPFPHPSPLLSLCSQRTRQGLSVSPSPCLPGRVTAGAPGQGHRSPALPAVHRGTRGEVHFHLPFF